MWFDIVIGYLGPTAVSKKLIHENIFSEQKDYFDEVMKSFFDARGNCNYKT
jgi:hypothetical protein